MEEGNPPGSGKAGAALDRERFDGLETDALHAERKFAWEERLQEFRPVSNGWLADRLQMGKAATVSQYVRRFYLARGICNGGVC